MDYSVLMSVYYKETSDNFHRCLASIYLQSLAPKEIVLVLDGQLTDELYSTIEYWKVKLPILTVPLENNVGLGKALNIGLDLCSCDLVARMDTDDICMPFRFQKQIEEFEKDSDLDICGTYIIEFDKSPDQVMSKRVLPILNDDIVSKCGWSNPFNHMTVMYKKSAVETAGGYRHMPWMEDWYLWLRMISINSKCLNIPEYLVKARTGAGMIERRSGLSYIKSEWMLTKIKVSLSLMSWPKSLFIFLVRSFPRVLPRKVLLSLYLIMRKT
ncbi:glycosyltransferase [Vibrio coralliirubri]|uniref:glycosyltransferase n=1 Tax=Vibrio coralliirubri TaxID=1516159 RepID=UPI000A398B7A|nr:glycosyltransferase [Vibrio coralliirubri]